MNAHSDFQDWQTRWRRGGALHGVKAFPDLFDKLRFMEAEARRLVNSDA